MVGLIYAAIYLAIHLAGTHTDAQDYWSVSLDQVYAGFTKFGPGYAYSPVFALMVAPLTAIPYTWFYATWLVTLLLVAFWLVRPLGWAWRLPLLLLTVPELLTGNIHLVLAATIVLGFSHPGWLAFPLLTKVTPAVSVIWFAVRREWGPLATTASVTVGLAVGAFVVYPELWVRWIDTLVANAASTGPAAVGLPLAVRLPAAVAVTVFAARTDRRWLVPIAAVLAMPWIYLQSLIVLLAIVRLYPPVDIHARFTSMN